MRSRTFIVLLALLTALVGASRASAAPAAAGPNPTTVVSLTFDDGTATQYQAGSMLSSHGMKGTFYINSSKLGTDSYYMTWNQVDSLSTAGNEIGGHTAYHIDIPQTDPTEAKRQVCDDRDNLVNRGYNVRSFAYPFGDYNAAAEALVQSCGYNSARTTSQFVPPPGLTIPPPDPYAMPVAGAAGTSVTLANLETYVTRVEQNGGGWAPLVFHQICNGCDANSIPAATLTAFLDWLQPRAANGTVVSTVGDVIGGTTQPAVAGPALPPAPNGANAIRNSSLEQDTNSDSTPDCFDFDSFGNNSFNWSRTTDAHTGTYAERVDISNYVDGDSKLSVTRDLGFCTPTVTPGHRYRITTWYKSNASVNFQAFTRDTVGGFYYWDSSPNFPATSTWAQASWVTAQIPTGVNGLQFGLALARNGSLTVDDIGIDDAAATGGADTTPPTITLTAPTAGTTVSGSVPISVDTSDNIAVDHVDYLVDNSVVGTQSSGPFSFPWNSRSVPVGNHTIKARAVDLAGNSATTPAITVNVSNSFTNLARNPSLENAAGGTPTCWLLGGYGTNSFAWTRTNDAHDGSFAENLSISSWTNGDRKLVGAQDTGTCSVPATPGHSYTFSGWYKVPAGFTGQPLIFGYYRNSAGAWTYWAQSARFANTSTWTQASWSTPAVPAGATAISIGLGLNAVGNVTMDDFTLYDNAPPPDVTAPTSVINCNGGSENDAGCAPGYYAPPVAVSLLATDEAGGSGVASIKYTTDGSDPTSTNGSVYDGPFSIGSTTTVKYRAFDKAGNAEAVNSQLIKVDSTPPTSAISCGGTTCQAGYYNSAVSVGLSATDTGGSGVRDIRYTTDGSDPSLTNGNVYLGPFSVTSTTTVSYRAYDDSGNAEPVNTQLIRIDTTAPTSTISCGLSACSTSPYFGSVSVALAATDAASGVSAIRYTTDGSDPSTTNGTTYTAAFNVTSTTTVKYRAYDNAGNAEPVNSQLIRIGSGSATLTTPTDGSTVSGTINLNVTVNGINVDHVDFLVDGTNVGTASVGPYTVGWDSTSVPDGQHTVIAHVFDTGNTETDTDPATVNVSNFAGDNTPPTSTITCNGSPCGAGSFNSAVSVHLSATDGAGGSGVQEIVYTTNGTDPSLTNGTTYTGSFSVSGTTTVKYRAYDNAGNVEPINTQAILIDTVAPNSSMLCNGAACASSYYATAVSVTLAASDSGGSGVAAIRYTTDGTDPTASNGSDYTGAFSLTSTKTVKYRAYDNAGNAEPINSSTIRVDTTPPQSTINCNGGSCSGYFKSGASVTLSATDADSGVASIKYTTDGSDPTATHGTTYAGAFTLNATTTIKYRAFDNVGISESVNSQQVQIDGTAPTASLTAPATGSLAAGTVTLTANASDNIAVDHVDFLVDGTTVGNDASSPYSFDWNSASVADGSHTLAAKAVDSAGNMTTSSSVSVVVINHNLLSNPSLETASGTTPTCWLLGGYGTNTFTWTRTSDAHTGSFGETLAMPSWTNGDRKLVSAQDNGACAPTATAGHTYTVTGWYKSTDLPVFFAYYRTSAGVWTYWAQSPTLAAVSSYALARWTTPTLPSGAVALSVGIGLTHSGTVTMDDFGLFATG